MKVFLDGKKTFIAIGLFVALAVISLIVGVVVPTWVFTILGALGLGFLRLAVKHLSGNSGWKTYGAVIATAGLGLTQAFGLTLTPEVLTTVYTVLGSLGIVGVRDALSEIPKK